MKIKKRMLIGLIREALSQADKDALINANSESLRKKTYRKLSMKHHPDRGGETSDFQELSNLFAALEDGSYKPAPKQQTKSREEKFVDYFSSFKSTTDEIFNATNDRELLKPYGNVLLDYYTRRNNQDDAYFVYNNAARIVNSTDFKFKDDHISQLGFNDEYVRWKFRSMMHAKKAANSRNINEVFNHARASIIELERVFNPGRGTSRQQWYLSKIYDALMKSDKNKARVLLDKVASENKLAFSQYNLYNTILSLTY